MALDATDFQFEQRLSNAQRAALSPARRFDELPQQTATARKEAAEPHLYEKYGLAPGHVKTDYSQQRAQNADGTVDPSDVPAVFHRNPNPPHINTTAPIYNKPGYTAGITTALLARYALEAIAQKRFSPVSSDGAKAKIEQDSKKAASKYINELQAAYDHAFNSDKSGELERFKRRALKDILAPWEDSVSDAGPKLDKHEKAFFALDERSSTTRKRFWTLVTNAESENTEGARGLYNTFKRIFGKAGETNQKAAAGTAIEESLRTFVRDSAEAGEAASITLRGDSKRHIEELLKPGIKKQYEGRFYDTMLGVYSLGLTTFYARKVYRDMRSLFDEAVGYELDKKPEDVTLGDVWNSRNGLVKETWNNWGSRNALRYATDLIFFGRHVKMDINFGHFGLASKAALIIKDITGRRLTTFEKLTSFVETVIKPEDGLGTPITTENLVDLFQAYAVHNRPDMSFQSTVGNNASEEVRWDYARQIFSRMSKLMNQSYSYKHEVRYDENFQPLAQSNFTLPVFIFMLGHDMIDPNNPNFTMARIEIASEYGVKAMKGAHEEFTAAQHLPEAAQLEVFNRVMSQFPEAQVTWRSRAERLETAKSRRPAERVAPLRPEDAPEAGQVNLESAQHEKLAERTHEPRVLS